MAQGSGGARLRSGPAPEPGSFRSSSKEWTTLPAEGRLTPAPEWPIPEQTDREADLWERYWRKPQAILWEKFGLDYEVALHVRRLVEVEVAGSSATLGTLVRQQMDALLLTIPAMRANLIKLSEDEIATRRPAPKVASSARARLKAVSGE